MDYYGVFRNLVYNLLLKTRFVYLVLEGIKNNKVDKFFQMDEVSKCLFYFTI
jgi:hypothetical protein